MTSPFLGELLGTLVLVLLGDGVVASVVLKKSKAEGGGWMVIATGWCFAVMAGVFTAIACGSNDAHLNPAVTLGFAVITGNYSKLVPYLVAQMLGAFWVRSSCGSTSCRIGGRHPMRRLSLRFFARRRQFETPSQTSRVKLSLRSCWYSLQHPSFLRLLRRILD